MGGHDGDGLDKVLPVNTWAQLLTLDGPLIFVHNKSRDP